MTDSKYFTTTKKGNSTQPIKESYLTALEDLSKGKTPLFSYKNLSGMSG